MKKIVLTCLALMALAACEVTPQEPIVSSYNGDSVNIVQPVFASYTDAQLLDKANSICQRGSRKFAERVSMRSLPDFQGTEYLFLCLNR